MNKNHQSLITASTALAMAAIAQGIDLYLWEKSNHQGLAYLGEGLLLAAVAVVAFLVFLISLPFVWSQNKKIAVFLALLMAILLIIHFTAG